MLDYIASVFPVVTFTIINILLVFLQLKDSVISQMKNVKVQSLEQANQMAVVLAMATEEKGEISPSSQVCSVVYAVLLSAV